MARSSRGGPAGDVNARTARPGGQGGTHRPAVLLCLGAVVMAAGTVVGCGSYPKASVGDPLVFTTVDIQSAVKADGQHVPSLPEDLKRHFRTRPIDYPEERLRMDDMLEGRQRLSGYFQAIQTHAAIDVVLDLMRQSSATGALAPTDGSRPQDGGGGSGSDSRPDVTREMTPQLAEYRAKLAEQLTALFEHVTEGAAADSPFDALDRATDFYTAYIVKILKLYGDSRTRITEHVDTTGAADTDRLILLLFQAHVDPGVRSNYMTKVRVRVRGTRMVDGTVLPRRWGMEADSPDLVKVARIHPTRSYDLDQASFGESLVQSLALTASVDAQGAGYDAAVNAARQAFLETEERRKFLSRISKNVSYADAAAHEFGWNFYPSNLEVRRRSEMSKFFGMLAGTPREYDLVARLDGGARDCAVYLVVPRYLESFTCSVVTSYESIDGGDAGSQAATCSPPRTFTVTLPAWDPDEAAQPASGLPMMRNGQEKEGAGTNPENRIGIVLQGTGQDRKYAIIKLGGAFAKDDQEKFSFFKKDGSKIEGAARASILEAGEWVKGEGRFAFSKAVFDRENVHSIAFDDGPKQIADPAERPAEP